MSKMFSSVSFTLIETFFLFYFVSKLNFCNIKQIKNVKTKKNFKLKCSFLPLLFHVDNMEYERMQCNGNEFFQQRGIVFIENFHVFGICGICICVCLCAGLYIFIMSLFDLVDVHKRSANLFYFIRPICGNIRICVIKMVSALHPIGADCVYIRFQ